MKYIHDISKRIIDIDWNKGNEDITQLMMVQAIIQMDRNKGNRHHSTNDGHTTNEDRDSARLIVNISSIPANTDIT